MDPTYVMLECEDNVTVDSLVNITMITFSCKVFNGTDKPLTISVYKGDNLTSYTSVPVTINNPTDDDYKGHNLTSCINVSVTINNPTDDDYGTYTFVASSEYCGSDTAEFRLLQRGQFCKWAVMSICNTQCDISVLKCIRTLRLILKRHFAVLAQLCMQ